MNGEFEELYCTIHVDSSMQTAELAEEIAAAIDGVRNRVTVKTPNCIVDVAPNGKFNPQRADDPESGHFYYRIRCDLEPAENAARDAYVDDVAKVLRFLRSNNCRAVPVCEFEMELP